MSNTSTERVTLEDIQSQIETEHYFTAADGIDGADLQRSREEDRDASVSFLPLSADNPKEGTPMGRLSTHTFCVIVFRNGFTLSGESACVDPKAFDAEKGRRLAYEAALDKAWPLFGFARREYMAFEAASA